MGDFASPQRVLEECGCARGSDGGVSVGVGTAELTCGPGNTNVRRERPNWGLAYLSRRLLRGTWRYDTGKGMPGSLTFRWTIDRRSAGP
jgi:hypothetical protein